MRYGARQVGAQLGTRGSQALGWEQACGRGLTCGARGRQARRARGPGVVRAAMRGLSVLLGQQAVHSVHSACFDRVSTQYYS